MSLKDTIIFESLKLFSEKGYCSTSINDILKAANTSKGGFYNHFAHKEALFFAVLKEAQKIWRDKVLFGFDEVDSPVGKIGLILRNYKDRYLRDTDNFPGGCIFITFLVELNDQRPALAKEVNQGFVRLKNMLKRILDEGKAAGELTADADTEAITEILFAGMLGSSVIYGVDKSTVNLDKSLNSFIDYLDTMKS
jgi:TetR/AcrR family transcriptional repressor of nem operon